MCRRMKFMAAVPQRKLVKEIKHTVGVVILVRYSSMRLPGKALMLINKKPVLQYIVERVTRVLKKEEVVIATSNEHTDDAIEHFAGEINISCYRGSLENVAERFYNAASGKGWEYAVRINGDNLFADVELLKEMIEFTSEHNYDFVSNVKDRTYPKGMSIEIVKLDYYKKLLLHIRQSSLYREHVTNYMYEHEAGQNFYYYKNTALPEAAGMQLALDTKEDFERSESIIKHFAKPHWTYNMKAMLEVMKQLHYA